jgi:hypothetical protein
MTQEQLMKVKIKYLEDRITTMEKSLGRINNILGRFQMTENQEQGFKDLEDIKDHVSKVNIIDDHELI